MKVLHIIPSIAQVRGGPSQAILEMVRALHSQDIDAEIVTTNDNGTDLLDVPLKQWIKYQQVPIQFFPRFSPPINSVREFAFSASLTSWLWQNAKNYDLLHIHALFSYPSTVAMAIARRQGIPYITRPLGQLCRWSLEQKASKKQFYLKLIEQANLNGTQALHLTSLQEQQEISQLGWDYPSFILPHGLSISPAIPNAREKLRQKLQLAEDEPIILFLSRLHPKKGLEYLIPALGKLTQQRFTFVLAGSGTAEYEAEVENLLVNAGISDRTYRAGFVAGEDKNLLLQGSDLFTLTSHSENFGVAVLEALAAGIPALVSPGVALASMLKQERVGYVTELNIDAITLSIEYCLDNVPELKQKGNLARQMIFEQYTWDKIVRKLLSAYQAILNQ
jgi:glycosyltransferase involved in cell wall biosynthesis